MSWRDADLGDASGLTAADARALPFLLASFV
ncbi:MAG: hypothetical protein RIQ68_2212 [Pseudomonadota bacterium]